MKIIDFNAACVEQAKQIALQNYNEERGRVLALPHVDSVPSLTPFAENGLGVAAFLGDTMLGFLCSVRPLSNSFGSTDAVGVFSPMGANGAIGANRAKVYALMYQAVAEKWVNVGASSHGISLYAHDKEAQEQFFRYGFGIRCVDAIRGMDEVVAPPCEAYSFFELAPADVLKVHPLENMLDDGYIDSPFFMYRARSSETAFLESYERFCSIYFTAEYKGQVVAFIRAEHDGETFIQYTPGYIHIKGAYCLPEHRGKGLSRILLSMLVQKLMTQGYTRLGVDFESFNPSGSEFWLKHFAAYTCGVVRRIDEYAITKRR